MQRCLNPDGTNNCFWADFNDETGRHDVIEEPDYLMQKNPKGVPPMRRVMQKCANGCVAWRTGQAMMNACEGYTEFKEQQSRTARFKTKLLTAKRETFKCRTERAGIPDKTNMFDYLTLMIEDSKVAYDWLMDIYATYGDVDAASVLSFFSRLNDMNVRGRQIDVIVAEWFPGYPSAMKKSFSDNFDKFVGDLKDDARGVAEHVNEKFDKSATEEAVPEGASIFAHKKLG